MLVGDKPIQNGKLTLSIKPTTETNVHMVQPRLEGELNTHRPTSANKNKKESKENTKEHETMKLCVNA